MIGKVFPSKYASSVITPKFHPAKILCYMVYLPFNIEDRCNRNIGETVNQMPNVRIVKFVINGGMSTTAYIFHGY